MRSKGLGKRFRYWLVVVVALLAVSTVAVAPVIALDRGDAPRATTAPTDSTEAPAWTGDWWAGLWSQVVSWLGGSSSLTPTCSDPTCTDDPSGGGETNTEGGGTPPGGDGGESGGGLDVTG